MKKGQDTLREAAKILKATEEFSIKQMVGQLAQSLTSPGVSYTQAAASLTYGLK